MKTYQCHKRVKAAKISGIQDNGGHYTRLHFVCVDGLGGDPDFDPNSIGAVDVDQSFIAKHKPAVGDYYVVYEDGYASISPAHAFESGYYPVAPPSPIVPLTDEQIMQQVDQFWVKRSECVEDIIGFARTIIAQARGEK